MRELVRVGVTGVVVLSLLAGCASGPSQEDLAKQARQQEEQQERERKAADEQRIKAEEVKRQEQERAAKEQQARTDLEAVLAKVAAAKQKGLAEEGQGKLRQAFQEYVGAVQLLNSQREYWGLGGERVLQARQSMLEQLFKVIGRLDPPPAVPEEAERYFHRGLARMKSAASDDDYARASREFVKALELAPWWGDAYYNLAVSSEKEGDPPTVTARLYHQYLLANPKAQDIRAVKAKLAELEVAAETFGPWYRFHLRWENGNVVQTITIRHGNLEVVTEQPPDHTYPKSVLTIKGREAEGTVYVRPQNKDFKRCLGTKYERPARAKLNEDGNILTLELKEAILNPSNCEVVLMEWFSMSNYTLPAETKK